MAPQPASGAGRSLSRVGGRLKSPGIRLGTRSGLGVVRISCVSVWEDVFPVRRLRTGDIHPGRRGTKRGFRTCSRARRLRKRARRSSTAILSESLDHASLRDIRSEPLSKRRRRHREVHSGSAFRVGKIHSENCAVVAIDDSFSVERPGFSQQVRWEVIAHRVEDHIPKTDRRVEVTSLGGVHAPRNRLRLVGVTRAEENLVPGTRPAGPQCAPIFPVPTIPILMDASRPDPVIDERKASLRNDGPGNLDPVDADPNQRV